MSVEDEGEDRQHRIVAGSNYGVVVTGDQNVQFNFGAAHGRAHSLASERQGLFFEFFRQALRQAETTFRLSVIFMSIGAAIVLTGGILALVNANNPDLNYVPLISALTGALITVGGGALAVHANRARKHLTEQANKLDLRVEEDVQLERARELIEQVSDPELRDRLKAMTALRALNMQPNADSVSDSVMPKLPQISRPETPMQPSD